MKYLCNLNVHKNAGVSKEFFLKLIKDVRFLRSCQASKCSVYITSAIEWKELHDYYDVINKGIFTDKKDFIYGIPEALYYWFKSLSLDQIQRQIVFWLADLYYSSDQVKRNILKDQLYPPLYDEVHKVYMQYYDGVISYDDDDFLDKIDKHFQSGIEEYSGKPNPPFLQTHSTMTFNNSRILDHNFGFTLTHGYFSENDWDQIIEKRIGGDDLQRCESRSDLYLMWKHCYTIGRKHVYSLFDSDKKVERKKVRENINNSLKTLIWQRDEGKCVVCGSNKNLEFDHIIPVSKGGATTYRNLQLLCECCNRKKRDKIDF